MITDFVTECIVFNKAFLYTTTTEESALVKGRFGNRIFDDIQLAYARGIAEIANKLHLPVLVFGKSNLGPGLLFDRFGRGVNEFIADKDTLRVFPHPFRGPFNQE